MNIYWKIGSYIIAIAVFAGAATWYGHSKYQTGYDQANLEANAAAAKISEQYRLVEQAAQKKANDEYAKYQDEKAKTDAANHDLANLADSLRRDISIYKRRIAEASTNPTGAIATGEVGIDVFYECTQRYSDLAKETGRIADSKNALIHQVSE